MRRLGALSLLAALGGCGDSSQAPSGAEPGGSSGSGGGGAGAVDAAPDSGGGGGTAGAAGGQGGAAGAPGGGGGAAGAAGAGGAAGAAGSLAQALIDALGSSVWQGLQTRDGKSRAYELRFDAPSLLWAEVRNPFGPARRREMRAFEVAADGASVHSTVVTPAGWPIDPENGREDDWTLEIVPGTPRRLRTVRAGVTEEFTEGAWPAPAEGLTSVVRVFPPSGDVFDAFCGQGSLGTVDHATLWKFARGESTEPDLGSDVVAGVALDGWTDPTGNNQFAVTDLPGMDLLGGTLLGDQFDFIALYAGSLEHPGGTLSLRERDDHVTDAVWAFLGANVGSDAPSDLFLEVHGLLWADLTADEPSATFPAQDLPIEVMILRCATQIADVDVEVRFASGAWQALGTAPARPRIDAELFPPVL